MSMFLIQGRVFPSYFRINTIVCNHFFIKGNLHGDGEESVVKTPTLFMGAYNIINNHNINDISYSLSLTQS